MSLNEGEKWGDIEESVVEDEAVSSPPVNRSGAKTREEMIADIEELLAAQKLTNAARVIKLGGLSDMYNIKDIIKRLAERKEFKEAAKVAKMFGLSEEFPPSSFTTRAFKAAAYRDFCTLVKNYDLPVQTDDYSALDVVDAELAKGALNDAVDHFISLKLNTISNGISVIDTLLSKRSFELAMRIAKACEGGPAVLLQRLEAMGEHRIAQVAVEVLAVRDLFPALACADYTSPVPAERTLWVCDESTLQQATHLLLHDSVDCVGIDIESQADFDTRKPSVGLQRDISVLRGALRAINPTAGLTAECILDLEDPFALLKTGLSFSLQKQAIYLLGKRLDKSQQVTDWAHRPLTDRQLAYAAADATVAIDLYDALAALLSVDLRAQFAKSLGTGLPRTPGASGTPKSAKRTPRTPSSAAAAAAAAVSPVPVTSAADGAPAGSGTGERVQRSQRTKQPQPHTRLVRQSSASPQSGVQAATCVADATAAASPASQPQTD